MLVGLHVMRDGCALGCGLREQADGHTPLFMASMNGHVEAVAALVGAGAAVNQASVSGNGRVEERSMFVCV